MLSSPRFGVLKANSSCPPLRRSVPFTDTGILTKSIPTMIRRLNSSGKFPTDIRIPTLTIEIVLESYPPKPRIIVRRLAVFV